MGDAGGHLPQRRQFVRLHQLGVERVHLLVGLFEMPHDQVRRKDRGQHDRQHRQGDDEDFRVAGLNQPAALIVGLLTDHQQPVFAFEPGAGVVMRHRAVHHLFHRNDPLVEMQGFDRGLAQHLAVETRRGLVDSLMVDNVGVAHASRLGRAHQAVEHLRIDGRA